MNPQSWIKTSQLLPEDGQEVFFYRAVGKGDVFRGTYEKNAAEAPRFRSSHGMSYWYPNEHVTHWMPSPTPTAPVEGQSDSTVTSDIHPITDTQRLDAIEDLYSNTKESEWQGGFMEKVSRSGFRKAIDARLAEHP